MSVDERLNLTQARLPQRTLSNVEFVGELCASLSLVVPSKRAQLTAQHRCDGGEVEAVVVLLEQVVQREEIADGGLVVARESRDRRGQPVHPVLACELARPVAPFLCNRPRLLEAAEHGK